MRLAGSSKGWLSRFSKQYLVYNLFNNTSQSSVRISVAIEWFQLTLDISRSELLFLRLVSLSWYIIFSSLSKTWLLRTLMLLAISVFGSLTFIVPASLMKLYLEGHNIVPTHFTQSRIPNFMTDVLSDTKWTLGMALLAGFGWCCLDDPHRVYYNNEQNCFQYFHSIDMIFYLITMSRKSYIYHILITVLTLLYEPACPRSLALNDWFILSSTASQKTIPDRL